MMTDSEYFVDKRIGSYLKMLGNYKKGLIYLEKARRYVPKNMRILGLMENVEMAMDLKYNLLNSYRNLCEEDKVMQIFEEYANDYDTGCHDIQMENCMILYETNKLETAKVEFMKAGNFFGGNNQKAFLDKNLIVTENIKDCLGESFDKFIIDNIDVFFLLHNERLKLMNADLRPPWKIKRDLGECDILSIPDKLELLESPCTLIRRLRRKLFYYQTYIGRSWEDMEFFKKLSSNKNYILPAFIDSTRKLRDLQKNFTIAAKSIAMLHARSPLYAQIYRRCRDARICKHSREMSLYMKQYQTRRHVFLILRTARDLREKKQLKKLRKFVRDTMLSVILCKTYRVLPWKTEMINEVYNILGLAYIDDLETPNLSDHDIGFTRLLKILKLPNSRKMSKKPEVNFFDRSTFDSVQSKTDKQSFLAHTLMHIMQSKHPIERCALYHEIAVFSLENNRHVETLAYAKKSMQEALVTKNHMWCFINYMLIFKAYTLFHKVELLNKILDAAYKTACTMKERNLCAFIELCRQDVKAELTLVESRKKDKSLFNKQKKIRGGDSFGAIASAISLSSIFSRDSEVP